MNKYLSAFAFLLTGLYLLNASWRAGLGLLLTSGIAGIGPDFLIFLAINLIGLYLAAVGIIYFFQEAMRHLKAWANPLPTTSMQARRK